MATLLSLKRRITAAQNVSKTTKAMQMIAASKLKKAQDAALSARPYVDRLSLLAQNIAIKTQADEKHPYMESQAKDTKTLLIALSPDKGLCGGLVTNLVKEFLNFVQEDKNPSFVVVGKKIEQQVVKLPHEILASFAFGTTLPTFDMVYPIKKLIDEYYLTGRVSTVKVLDTNFASFFSQTPQVTTLLPITLTEQSDTDADVKETFQLVEPSLSEIIPSLLDHYVEMSLYQSLLESYLSEQAARMMAMQNATTNAKDIIESLQLEYNKTRQAKITSELLDLVGGRIAHGQ